MWDQIALIIKTLMKQWLWDKDTGCGQRRDKARMTRSGMKAM